VQANNILIDWQAPSTDSLHDYGTAITGYRILIQSSDTIEFYEDLVNCDGSNPAIVSSTSCEIPMSTLQGTPFMLNLGQSVYAKVAAVNEINSSPNSVPGNGASITLSFVPDAPVNLLRNELLTTRSQISLSWEAGASNGGQPILDYRVSYDQAAGIWTIL
jgi:hypothetical protein